MLFSIVPPEDVWSEPPPDVAASPPQCVRLSEGCFVYVCRAPEGYRVMRLVSSEPRHYLDPALQPGMPWSMWPYGQGR